MLPVLLEALGASVASCSFGGTGDSVASCSFGGTFQETIFLAEVYLLFVFHFLVLFS